MNQEDLKEWVTVSHPTETEMMLLESEQELPELEPMKIVFKEPAKYWTDAIPIGNGSLGAMVWGGVANETIQLNHDTLWTGTPGNYTDPHAQAILQDVRKLVDSGNYAEASLAAFGLSGNPSDVYQPLGDLKLKFGDSHEIFTDYQRQLDLDNATARVKYSLVGGDVQDVCFTREYFCSNPDQVLAIKISANKAGCVSFVASFDSKMHHHSVTANTNQIILNGSCPGKRIPPKSSSNANNPQGIKFSSVVDIQIGGDFGSITVQDNRKLKIKGSDWAILLLTASSTFDGPFVKPIDSSKEDPTSVSMDSLSSVKNITFSNLYAHHLSDYQQFFHRVTLQLWKTTNNGGDVQKMSTAERIKSFKVDEDPSLVQLLFQYGRYLLIASSRPGTQVTNLQGIWSHLIEPAWDGAPHLNINLQMNYWLCLPCNLSECQKPLFDYISSLAVNGTKTAKINYDASGWVVHQVSDIWAKTSPDRGDPVWAMWPMGGAWLCTHLWQHYAFSLDKDFLEKLAYPLMEGCASFLLDWLIEGEGRYLETNPSTSPEHYFIAPNGKKASVSYSSTMDIAIIRQVFHDFIAASKVLGKGETGLMTDRIRKAMARLPPTKIARDGSIMEWAKDFHDPEEHHRHVSHLFGLFPGNTISMEKNPDLCKAIDYSLYKRGDVGPGWSIVWKMAMWARLGNSLHSYNMIKGLINLIDPAHEDAFEGGLYSNMFTAHPPFQIDANFGFAAALTEMLVQSTESDVYLLPALPREKWPSGCVKGLKARNDITVSICWKEGVLHQANLFSKNQNLKIKLHYNGIVGIVRLSSGSIHSLNKNLKCSSSNTKL